MKEDKLFSLSTEGRNEEPTLILSWKIAVEHIAGEGKQSRLLEVLRAYDTVEV